MRFSKMHGLGNDFMMVDTITQNAFFSSELIRYLSNRRLGVGFDQLIIVEHPRNQNSDFHFRIFNADGSEVGQCGNGARCLARFVYVKGLTNKKNIYVSTSYRNMKLSLIENELVRVNMGKPNFEPSKIPFLAKKAKKKYILYVKKQKLLCSVVSIGNPHCIIQVDDIKTAEIKTLGPALESHKYFPEQANIGFMQINQRKHIYLRVYERGVGETLACASSACAAVAVGISQGLLEEEVCVDLPGGKLNIFWKGYGSSLYMTGPASFVYDGFICL